MGMESFLAGLVKPLILAAAVALLLGVRYGVVRWMPEGRLKNLLLTSDRPLRYGGRTYGGPNATDAAKRDKDFPLDGGR